MKFEWKPPKHRLSVSTHTWDTEYAAINHEGGTMTDGQTFPARPWVWQAIDDVYPVDIFAQVFRQTGNLDEAFVTASELFAEAAKAAIESPIWPWPGKTIRMNGEIVGSPRDIVDTGTLRDSYSMDIK